MICSLDESSARDVLIAGGKAAALAKLIARHFPIPEGFIVTTPAERDLSAHLDAIEHRIAPNSVFAVRSSGYSEDSADSSFAGQYETVLGVRGLEAVSSAITRCFESFYNGRSAAYRASCAAEMRGGAVIVQRLVEADAAGVAFTADPVTGARDRICIEANFGLGDSVVGGHVNPDGFTVIRETGEIAERRIAEKHVRSVLISGGSLLEPMPEELVRKACLTEEAVHAVAGIASRVEEHFGRPVDIEWAWKDRKIWLLQARAVTRSRIVTPLEK
jgi:pyruvate,water dikinase